MNDDEMAAQVFDCPACGDGTALREGEECPYCEAQPEFQSDASKAMAEAHAAWEAREIKEGRDVQQAMEIRT